MLQTKGTPLTSESRDSEKKKWGHTSQTRQFLEATQGYIHFVYFAVFVLKKLNHEIREDHEKNGGNNLETV